MMRCLCLLSCCFGLIIATGCGQNRSAAHDAVHIAALEVQVADQENLLAEKDATISNLQSQLANTQQAKPEPQDDLADVRSDLAGSGANVSWRGGELVIDITNDILFRSGSATLTAQAKGSLRTVARTLQSRYQGQFIRIEGHTDNQPIRRTRNKWEDNWHLAGARARSVLHELIERNGLPREMISFAGYADTRPVDSNSSRKGRAQNRRVAIVVLPAERP